MKKVIISLIILLAFVPSAISTEFWASKSSNKYHYPTCQWAKRIKPSNLIKFSSPEEAIQAGYVPCKVCKPPVSSKASIDEPTDKIYAEAQQPFNIDRECCYSIH